MQKAQLLLPLPEKTRQSSNRLCGMQHALLREKPFTYRNTFTQIHELLDMPYGVCRQ